VAIPDVKTNSKKRRTSGDAFLIALLVAGGAIIVCLRLFVFQPFNIPSGSMVPTLIPGDYVLVSKISYGYGPYSLPLATAGLSHRIPASWLPERGDVVVFRVTGKTAVDFIKRVVGRPGDRVQMTKGVLSINGVAVPRQRIGDTTNEGSNQHRTRYRETLPSGVSYMTLSLDDNGIYATTPEYIVPPGHYFVLGDNRDNSVDSRMLDQVGYVPVENMIGRAEIILFSGGADGLRWDRMFQAVR
jgi:signal peptidase I